jgi:hypothetical protein
MFMTRTLRNLVAFFGGFLLIVMAAKSMGAEPVTKPETLQNDTSGLLLVVLDDKPMGFVFISKTGQILPESPSACQANKDCTLLVQRLVDAGRVTTLQLSSANALKRPIT